MCGLIAYISKDDKTHTGNMIIEQYQDQHSRGTEGFGLISIQDQEFTIQRATEPTKALLDAKFSGEQIQLFHHRRPTSTDNELEQTHPIYVSHDELKYDYYVMHNGVISNEDELFKKHTTELGYTYTTYSFTESSYGAGYSYKREKFNDSEAFAIELVRYLERLSKEIGTRGSAAFLAVQVDKKSDKATKIFWGRNDFNPLDILDDEDGILIASDIRAMAAESIEKDTYQVLDLKKLAKKKATTPIKSFISNRKLKFYTPPTVTKTITVTKKDDDKKEESKSSSTVTTNTRVEKVGTPVSGKTTIKKEESTKTPYSARIEAFTKMSDRFMNNIWPDVETLFLDMAFEDLDETQLDYLLSDMKDLILEKEKEAKERIRPLFDYEEDKAFNDLDRATRSTDELEREAYDKMRDEEIGISEKTIAELTDQEMEAAYEREYHRRNRRNDVILPGGMNRFGYHW